MTAKDSSSLPRGDMIAQQAQTIQVQESTPHLPRVRQTQLNIALHLLQTGDQIILVQGAAGMGKTSFLRALAQLQPDLLLIHRVSASATQDLTVLLTGFGAGPQAPVTPLEALRAVNRLGARPALLIDDADQLPDKALASVLALWRQAQAEEIPFSLALSAPPAAEQRLEQLGALQPNQLHSINLQRLTVDQTLDYLQQRLVGTTIQLPLNKLRAIHHRARGIPATIEQELEQLLGSRNSGQPQPAKVRLPAAGQRSTLLLVVIALMALVIGLLAALRYAEQPAEIPAPLAQPLQRDSEPLPLISNVEPQQPAAIAPPADPPPALAPLEALSEPEPAEPEVLLIPSEPELSPLAVDAQPPATAEPVAAEVEAEPLVAAPEATESIPSEADAAAPVVLPSPAVPLKDNAWLRSRNPARFTIQLIAANDATALADFIRQRQLEEQAALLTVERNRRDWHVVVLGDYPSRAAGRAALQRLPQALREDGAWIRSFGELQQQARD